MMNNPWGSTQQTMLICIDSYEKGVLVGQVFLPGQDGERFDSLSQFLLRTERLMEHRGTPQSFTTPRLFAMPKKLEGAPADISELSRGALATFEMRVLFRQHASWQGELQWLERNTQQNFRSVLELVTLMDSALREDRG